MDFIRKKVEEILADPGNYIEHEYYYGVDGSETFAGPEQAEIYSLLMAVLIAGYLDGVHSRAKGPVELLDGRRI